MHWNVIACPSRWGQIKRKKTTKQSYRVHQNCPSGQSFVKLYFSFDHNVTNKKKGKKEKKKKLPLLKFEKRIDRLYHPWTTVWPRSTLRRRLGREDSWMKFLGRTVRLGFEKKKETKGGGGERSWPDNVQILQPRHLYSHHPFPFFPFSYYSKALLDARIKNEKTPWPEIFHERFFSTIPT